MFAQIFSRIVVPGDRIILFHFSSRAFLYYNTGGILFLRSEVLSHVVDKAVSSSDCFQASVIYGDHFKALEDRGCKEKGRIVR